ncbi:hypothetical protein NDU88_006074 [Pleurodeles waltl]|uniref:Uncharacterized protein n=1 Tax=Pleurodeles waltl TaxID=8319 RepID=A0AAV7MER7_PLEWA|nr:hypothetical protein NDU88_006074 [Pleurodeles waltl]
MHSSAAPPPQQEISVLWRQQHSAACMHGSQEREELILTGGRAAEPARVCHEGAAYWHALPRLGAAPLAGSPSHALMETDGRDPLPSESSALTSGAGTAAGSPNARLGRQWGAAQCGLRGAGHLSLPYSGPDGQR